MPVTRVSLIELINQRLDYISQRVKSLTGIGLNDAAKWLEPFAARLLNAVYGWRLSDPAPGNPVTKGIDLADVAGSVAVQVSVQDSAEKIKHTVAMLADGKFARFTTIAVFYCHRKKHKNTHGLRIINIGTLLGDLEGKDLDFLWNIIATLDAAISSHTPDNFKKDAHLATYLAGLVTAFQGYDEIGIEKGKEGEDQSPPIWKIFVPPACTAERACSPAEMEASQRAEEPTTPATALLPLLADSQNRRHVLLGDPGMGKSTLIQRLTAGIASGQSTPGATALDSCLPVPIILRDIVPHLPADPADWTWSTLCETLRTKYQRSEDAPCLYSPWADLRSLRDELLSDPRAFFLVDGLDEIGDLTKRTALRDAIWEGFRTCPGARWLVTSRIVGYDLAEVHREFFQEVRPDERSREGVMSKVRVPDAMFSKWESLGFTRNDALLEHKGRGDDVFSVGVHLATCLYLAPFDDSQQDAFVTNWFRARKAPNTPPGLLGDIRSREHEGIRVLARVPNLLSYMAILKRDGKPLPDGRADLYMAIARAYLFGIDKSYRLSKKHGHDCPIPFEGRLRLLAILAGEMQHRRAADIAAREAEIKARRERGERGNPEKAETEGNITISGHDLRSLLRGPLAGLMKDCDVEQELTDFLHFILSRSGLLLDRGTAADGGTLFGFTHLSFLEFFAACYLRAELEHENALILAASRARKSPDDPGFTQTYLAKYPRGPRTVVSADLAGFAARPEWHEVLIFLAEFYHDSASELDPVLEQLFPALHSTADIPLRVDEDKNYPPLLPRSAASLAIRLARDAHLKLPAETRLAWFTRLWDAFLAWRFRISYSPPWPVNALLLDRPAHEPEALAALRAAAARHPGLTSLGMWFCPGLTDAALLRELWPFLEKLSLYGCTGLRAVGTLPASLTVLLLNECTGLSAVDALPASLTTLYLTDCTGLSAVDALPASLTTLDLTGCPGLRAVDVLPASLTQLVLDGCTGLSAVDALPASLTTLWLNGCTGLSAEAVARVKQALPGCRIHGP